MHFGKQLPPSDSDLQPLDAVPLPYSCVLVISRTLENFRHEETQTQFVAQADAFDVALGLWPDVHQSLAVVICSPINDPESTHHSDGVVRP
jgi:hypothetical protein